MTDPLAFLAAVLPAAQRDAEAATAGPWYANEPPNGVSSGPSIGTGRVDWGPSLRDVVAPGDFNNRFSGVRHLADAQFIAANSPDVVLRRIAADRKTLTLHEGAHECSSYDWTMKDINPCMWVPADEHCTTVRNMAEGWGWTEETP